MYACEYQIATSTCSNLEHDKNTHKDKHSNASYSAGGLSLCIFDALAWNSKSQVTITPPPSSKKTLHELWISNVR